jgi:alpha-methylacyl-CoA racemase
MRSTVPNPNDEPARHGPLTGVRVLELAGLGPGPHAAMLLADLGADVVRVDRPAGRMLQFGDGTVADQVLRNRRSVHADLKDPADLAMVQALADRADVLVEGLRPGVTERLGLGAQDCLARNPRLVYARITGWGQTGPWAERVGHDINYLSITGSLAAIGPADGRPVLPLNLVADFGGGSMFCVLGILAALVERAASGRGQVVDAAMVDGVTALSQMVWALRGQGVWSDERGSNLLDGGTPFYDTYTCADGRHVAVGALEPHFYAALLAGLGLDGAGLPAQADRAGWPVLRAALPARPGRPGRVARAAGGLRRGVRDPHPRRVGRCVRRHRRLRDAGAHLRGGADAPAPGRTGYARHPRRRPAGRAGAALLADTAGRPAPPAAPGRRHRRRPERLGRRTRIDRGTGRGSPMTAGPHEVGPADPTDLASYPFVHTVRARFADVDSLGHLNNVAIVAYYEDARVEFLREVVGAGQAGAMTRNDPWYVVLAEQTIRYLAQAEYPGTYQVAMGVARLGTSSAVLLAGLFADGRCVGLARNVLVHMVGAGTAPIEGERRTQLEKASFASA